MVKLNILLRGLLTRHIPIARKDQKQMSIVVSVPSWHTITGEGVIWILHIYFGGGKAIFKIKPNQT